MNWGNNNKQDYYLVSFGQNQQNYLWAHPYKAKIMPITPPPKMAVLFWLFDCFKMILFLSKNFIFKFYLIFYNYLNIKLNLKDKFK